MSRFTLSLAALALAAQATSAQALEEITVAYFLEWSHPFQAAKVDATFEKELGVKVNWRSFDTGVAMSVAAAAGVGRKPDRGARG